MTAVAEWSVSAEAMAAAVALATARRYRVLVDARYVCGEVPAFDVIEALLLLLGGMFDQLRADQVDEVLRRVGQLAAMARDGRHG